VAAQLVRPETEQEEWTVQDTVLGSLSSPSSSFFTPLDREEINREYDDIENP
jgi:hypothetical protein